MNKLIDRGKYEKGDILLIGGEERLVIKRSWFTDRYGFYKYQLKEPVSITLDCRNSSGI